MRHPVVPRRLQRGALADDRRLPRRAPAAALLAIALAAAACGSGQDPTLPAAASTSTSTSTTSTSTSTSTTTTVPTTTTPTTVPPQPGTCPVLPPRNQLDPDRPTYDVDATIDVAAGTVDGTVAIGFTPDLPTDVLVLRLWPNGPRPIGDLTVTSSSLPAEQPDPTTLLLRPASPLAAGERVDVTVGFHLAVTGAADDRISHAGDTMRLGSAFPLLAWEPGVGWATEPPTGAFAEASTAPAADWTLRLAVTPGYDVVASGVPQADGSWLAVGARDVGISVGHFAATTVTTTVHVPDPVEVTVSVDASLAGSDDPQRYLDVVVDALGAMSRRYGAYPYERFSLALTPGLGGGIEYPGHVMQGPDTDGRTTPHEVAHQWFYGLVGNDQGRDPWLDEGLATWAELRHLGSLADAAQRSIPADAAGRAGEPMTYWEAHQGSYYRGVYVQPAGALARLGQPELVDCALALLVAERAWTIATPADAVEALAAVVPGVADALAAAGITP